MENNRYTEAIIHAIGKSADSDYIGTAASKGCPLDPYEYRWPRVIEP